MGAGGPAEAAPAADSDADRPWRAYLPLWQALICGGAAPDEDAARLHAPARQRDAPAWAQALYDTLMSASLDALRGLDLAYTQAAETQPATGAVEPEVRSLLSSSYSLVE